MFWGSQAEDLEHRRMAEDQNSVNGKTQDSNGEKEDSNGEKQDSNGEKQESNGERRDSKGRLLPNPVLCCESLSVRATAQVHQAILNNGNYIWQWFDINHCK